MDQTLLVVSCLQPWTHTTDDEPANGPDVYYVLHGFTSPGLVGALAQCNAGLSAVVRLIADEVCNFLLLLFMYARLKVLRVRSPLGLIFELQQSRALVFVSSYCLCHHSGPVRDIAWLDLPIGGSQGVEPDPPCIFDAMALVLYEALQREASHLMYSERMTLYALNAVSIEATDVSVYKKCVLQFEYRVSHIQTC
jgi:hypothetical protein